MFINPIILECEYDSKKIMTLMQCNKSSDAYPLFLEVFSKFEKNIKKEIQVIAYVHIEEETVYCLLTMGKYLENYVNKLFSQGNYLEAMIHNEIGDQIIFRGTEKLYKILEKKIEGFGFLSKRYEPGTGTTSINAMYKIYSKIQKHHKTAVEITEQGMLFPVKSIAYYYKINKQKSDLYQDRDCNDCNKMECKHRQYRIRIKRGKETRQLTANHGSNMMEILRDAKILVSTHCNGKGTCGKCKVKCIEGNLDYTKIEHAYLSEKEKANRIILACCHKIESDLTLEIHENQPSYTNIEGRFFLEKNQQKSDLSGYAIGIDLGTTTIVMSLVNLHEDKEVKQLRILNPQRAYGSDVISRIAYNNKNTYNHLGKGINQTIQTGINQLLVENNILEKDIVSVTVAANTAMTYFLLGIPSEGLAIAPYKVYSFKYKKYKIDKYKINVFPWISAFVGGDILAGLYAIREEERQKTSIYIDIGTNGEIVLFHKGAFYCASAAAGPAFEGANIRHGMGSVAGAISHVKIQEGMETYSYDYETIQGKRPIGLCGSGIIDLIAELIKIKVIDETGYMEKAIPIYNEIELLPVDVRQVQLAKAAIAAGIDTLMATHSLKDNDIENVYIAGGFGSGLNIDSIGVIGLLSGLDLNKVKVLGNMALAGTIKFAQKDKPWLEINRILGKCTYVELSNNRFFNQFYIEHMTFKNRNGEDG